MKGLVLRIGLPVWVLAGCSVWTAEVQPVPVRGAAVQQRLHSPSARLPAVDHMPLVWAAERQAQGKVKGILAQARTMALLRKEVVQGSCWDYLDVLYTRAGVPRQARKTVHKGTFANGPFADPNHLRTGDWIYHVNHNYRNNEHSGMFIAWVDKDRRLGLTLSYAGEGRRDPARYKVYDLSSVYNIMRAE